MATNTNLLSILFSILVILFSIQRSVLSFSVDLIHRDSPQSPLYDHFATKWDRLDSALRRTASRVDTLIRRPPKGMDLRLSLGYGEIIMKLFIGTPPVPQFALIDTGSDLIWFQVNGCTVCFDQKSQKYDPKHSMTFRNVSCNTPSCKTVAFSKCSANSTATCRYQIGYQSQTFSSGYVGSETFTFGSISKPIASIPKVIFGCGTMNIHYDYARYIDGFIGLGNGNESFVNQASKYTSRKFSYCLPPFDSSPNATGKISFGNSALVSTPDDVIIPLQRNEKFYIVSLENIFINNQRFSSSEERDIDITIVDTIIDSGSMFTYLPNILYDKLSSEVQKYIPAKAFTNRTAEICYRKKDIVKFPTITLKFKGGAELDLTEKSTFYHINPEAVCLAIASSGSDNIGIIGNIAQANFLVGFDLDKNLVSFKPSDCTNIKY